MNDATDTLMLFNTRDDVINGRALAVAMTMTKTVAFS
jgi:hypothetical protein